MDENYTLEEIEEIEKSAIKFKKGNFFRLPCILRGNKVASRNPESQVENYSTITDCFPLSSGKWIFLVYAYPLSIIHRLLDGLAKWATEKYCIKSLTPKKWQQAFIKNSFIPIINIQMPNVIAMPYVDNENLFDVLSDRIPKYHFEEKRGMIKKACLVINEMHGRNIMWGELIAPNMIYTSHGEIIICDTETQYYRGNIIEQKSSDWLDFICSTCGAMVKAYGEIVVAPIIEDIVWRIKNRKVANHLKIRCQKKRTWLHRLFSAYTAERLACPPKLYDNIKRIIAAS
ncbi:MAG: hypothetical protein PHD51_04095 [Patescibacteria group bacterium]|nr:hypothetical protein [Patescibacteria group bacterium]MDD5490807.1 hypothetical protein [Patescibacteria group bacterium]